MVLKWMVNISVNESWRQKVKLAFADDKKSFPQYSQPVLRKLLDSLSILKALGVCDYWEQDAFLIWEDFCKIFLGGNPEFWPLALEISEDLPANFVNHRTVFKAQRNLILIFLIWDILKERSLGICKAYTEGRTHLAYWWKHQRAQNKTI